MCVPKNKFFLFFLALALCVGFFANEALARTIDFTRKNAGFTLEGGLTENPVMSFLAKNAGAARSKTYALGLDAFYRIDNMLFSPVVNLYFPPRVTGSGNDPTLVSDYTEETLSSLYSYGGKFTLIPYLSPSKKLITFIGFSGGITHFTATNTRNYITAAGAVTNTYQEKVSGKSPYVQIETGFSFFIFQNYALGFATGYRQVKFGELNYKTVNDRTNTYKGVGTKVLNAAGNSATTNFSSSFTTLKLSLHF